MSDEDMETMSVDEEVEARLAAEEALDDAEPETAVDEYGEPLEPEDRETQWQAYAEGQEELQEASAERISELEQKLDKAADRVRRIESDNPVTRLGAQRDAEGFENLDAIEAEAVAAAERGETPEAFMAEPEMALDEYGFELEPKGEAGMDYDPATDDFDPDPQGSLMDLHPEIEEAEADREAEQARMDPYRDGSWGTYTGDKKGDTDEDDDSEMWD